jgi:hypothetical protein
MKSATAVLWCPAAAESEIIRPQRTWLDYTQAANAGILVSTASYRASLNTIPSRTQGNGRHKQLENIYSDGQTLLLNWFF